MIYHDLAIKVAIFKRFVSLPNGTFFLLQCVRIGVHPHSNGDQMLVGEVYPRDEFCWRNHPTTFVNHYEPYKVVSGEKLVRKP